MSALPERIVCAANRYSQFSGEHRIICGIRHCDETMGRIVDALDIDPNETEVQGFMTNKGRFVDRIEAWVIAEKQKQVIRRVGHDGPDLSGLFSENLY